MYSVLAFTVLISVSNTSPFQVQLHVPAEVELGETVNCKVRISNPTNSDYLLFHRGTPMENTMSDIFIIAKNSLKVNYDGPMLKKSPVNQQSKAITLKSHSFVMATVDLASVYSLREKSTYTVSLSSQIHFLKVGGHLLKHGHLHSSPAKFTIFGDKSTNAKKTLGEKHRQERRASEKKSKKSEEYCCPRSVTLAGSYSSVDEKEVRKAWVLAYRGIVEGQKKGDKVEKQYQYWFGMRRSKAPNHSKKMLQKIQTVMEKSKFTLHFGGRYCEGEEYAYTYYDSNTVFLCNFFSSCPLSGYNSKMGVLVHELTQAVMKTKGLAYGQFHSRTLAMRKPGKALTNADNYEYFIESLKSEK